LANPSPSPSIVDLAVPAQPADLSASFSTAPPLTPSTDPTARDEDGPPPASSLSLTHSHLERFAHCPLSFRLHYFDRLTADVAAEGHFGLVVHRALAHTVREHVKAGIDGALDPELAASAYRRAWSDSELRDHGVFGEGLALLHRWVAREGRVDPERVLGIEQLFELPVGPIRVQGTLDRVDRISDDTVMVRDYKTTRLPPSRKDAEDSLRLALYDLAARVLWPWAKRVVVAFDLLRHDAVVAITRSAEEREATRRYILATVAQIERREFPARPSTLCAHCDHRSQCPTYADARSGKRTEVGAEPGDLPAVAREREEVVVLLKALGERKDTLDAILRAALGDRNEVRLGGRRYALVTAMHRDYPLPETLHALEAAGVARETALARLGAVHGSPLKTLLADLAKALPRPEFEALQAALDREARCSPVVRLTVREVRS
jgi:putative RecB family exonuclease